MLIRYTEQTKMCYKGGEIIIKSNSQEHVEYLTVFFKFCVLYEEKVSLIHVTRSLETYLLEKDYKDITRLARDALRFRR